MKLLDKLFGFTDTNTEEENQYEIIHFPANKIYMVRYKGKYLNRRWPSGRIELDRDDLFATYLNSERDARVLIAQHKERSAGTGVNIIKV